MKKQDKQDPSTTAVEKAAPSAVPAVFDPTSAFLEDAGKGVEGADRKSFAIPFIAVLQGTSPAVEKIDNAKPGMFINTITNELYKEVQVIPCAFRRRFIRWAPRDEGGGYKGEYDPNDVETNKVEGMAIDENNKYFIGDDELKDTRNHFCLVQSANGGWQPAVISLTSTQIKKSKRWMSRIAGIELKHPTAGTYNPPSFSHIYKLRTIKEENSQGSWWGIEVDMVGPVADGALFGKAKAFNVSVNKGEVETAAPPADSPAPDGRF